MNTILIRNNEPRMHGLALPHRQNAVPTAPETITLKPGINEIDSEKWAKVKDDAIVRNYLTNSTLSSGGRPVFEVVEQREGLYLALVAETFDRELLRKWLEAEKEPSTVSAIQAQLARIAPQNPNSPLIVPAMAPETAKEQARRAR